MNRLTCPFIKVKVYEEMSCMSLEGTCTRRDIFKKPNTKLQEGLSWENCLCVYKWSRCYAGGTKRTKSLCFGSRSAFEIFYTASSTERPWLARQIHTHTELCSVLHTAANVVHFIKSRLFATLCQEMGLDHESLLFHMEIRCFLRVKY